MPSQTPPDAKQPRLLDQVRETLRLNRYSPRTEAAYVDEENFGIFVDE